MTVRIVTDSTCDLPAEVIAEHKIAVVPLYINFGDRSFLDGVRPSRAEFYARLPSSNPPPTTSAPGTAAFADRYQGLVAEGASGILSIHIGSALSNVYNVAQMAAATITDVPVRVLDGGQITLGTGTPGGARRASGRLRSIAGGDRDLGRGACRADALLRCLRHPGISSAQRARQPGHVLHRHAVEDETDPQDARRPGHHRSGAVPARAPSLAWSTWRYSSGRSRASPWSMPAPPSDWSCCASRCRRVCPAYPSAWWVRWRR